MPGPNSLAPIVAGVNRAFGSLPVDLVEDHKRLQIYVIAGGPDNCDIPLELFDHVGPLRDSDVQVTIYLIRAAAEEDEAWGATVQSFTDLITGAEWGSVLECALGEGFGEARVDLDAICSDGITNG